MAINDTAVLTAAKGFIFTAPPNTVAPTPAVIAAYTAGATVSGWDNIGHTSADELPEFGFEGGETETRGTWQNSALREVVTEAVADYVTFNAHQWDENTLKLYYGVSDPGSTAGAFVVQNATTGTTEKALLIIIMDGDIAVAFHAGRTSIRRNDAISLDTDSFAYLPLRATILKGTSPLLSWIGTETGVNDGTA